MYFFVCSSSVVAFRETWSRDEREQIVRAKTGRAPCEHCRFRELKFSIRKYVIVVLANETAEEVEETDIPGISVDRRSYSHGCSRGFLHWQSWFSDKLSRIVRFAVPVVSLRETSNIGSPVSDVSTGRHWICSHDLFLLLTLSGITISFFHSATGDHTARFLSSLIILFYEYQHVQELLHRIINNICVAYRKFAIINVRTFNFCKLDEFD